jgi:hypothetical protein
MDLIELINFYNVSQKHLLLNLVNILKSTTKKVKKGEEKKSTQNFFIL